MSTTPEPPGTEPEDGLPAQGDPELPSEADSDPVTEVIDVGAEVRAAAPPEADLGERRYTAPGFDAGSTQIIDRVDEHPTELIEAPTEVFGAESRPRTGPQTIAPRVETRRRWLTPAVLAIAGVLAAAVLGMILLKRSTGPTVSQEDLVRSSIQTFDNAVQQGDLATLRSITCGQTRDTYVNYDDQTWSDTYSKVLAAKQYPVVASIDEVVVNGDHAEADVTSYMAFDPATTSTRSFDLKYTDEQWKICQSS